MNNGQICVTYNLVCIECKEKWLLESGDALLSLMVFVRNAERAGWGKRQDGKWVCQACLEKHYEPIAQGGEE